MIQAAMKPIWLLSGEERSMFDPMELRDTLVRCFLGAGLEESCYLAGDIALAVEYALEHSGRDERVFSRREVDDMVIRILENTGYGEVSAVYRRGAPVQSKVSFSAAFPCVEQVLRKYFAGSAEHLRELAGLVSGALGKLGADEAAPELMVELARHFDSFAPASPITLPEALPGSPAVRRVDDRFVLTPQEVRTLLGPAEGLPENVCRLHGVGRLFPSIRAALFLTRMAKKAEWEPPMLEMELQPVLAEAGLRLSGLRDRIQSLYRERSGKPAAALPFYLTVPDMDDFIGEYLESSPDGVPGLRQSVADMILAGIRGPVEKIRFAE